MTTATGAGLDAFAEFLASIPDVAQIEIARIKRAPRLQSRGGDSPAATDLMRQARDWYDSDGIPFWDALFVLGERDSGGVPDSVLQSALFHQDITDSARTVIGVDSSLGENLRAVVAEYGDDWIVSMLSTVTMTDGSMRFLPMLDFTTKVVRSGARHTVEGALRAMDEPGVLLSSGRSFHFYGQVPLTRDGMHRFLAKALLLAPITDSRWIAHQMLAGVAALRISNDDRGREPLLLRSALGGKKW